MEGFNIKFDRFAKSISFKESNCGPNVGLRGLFNENCDIINKCEFKNVPANNESFFENNIFWIFSLTCKLPQNFNYTPLSENYYILVLVIFAAIGLLFVFKRRKNSWTANVFITMSGDPQLITED